MSNFKHISFSESIVMHELEKIARDKNLIEEDLFIPTLKKKASNKLVESDDLFVDTLSLASALRDKGFMKQAASLEEKAILFKQAYNNGEQPVEERVEREKYLYNTGLGTGILENAHQVLDLPKLQSTINEGHIETIEEINKIMVDSTKKAPTGKLGQNDFSRNLVALAEAALNKKAQDGSSQNAGEGPATVAPAKAPTAKDYVTGAGGSVGGGSTNVDESKITPGAAASTSINPGSSSTQDPDQINKNIDTEIISANQDFNTTVQNFTKLSQAALGVQNFLGTSDDDIIKSIYTRASKKDDIASFYYETIAPKISQEVGADFAAFYNQYSRVMNSLQAQGLSNFQASEQNINAVLNLPADIKSLFGMQNLTLNEFNQDVGRQKGIIEGINSKINEFSAKYKKALELIKNGQSVYVKGLSAKISPYLLNLNESLKEIKEINTKDYLNIINSLTKQEVAIKALGSGSPKLIELILLLGAVAGNNAAINSSYINIGATHTALKDKIQQHPLGKALWSRPVNQTDTQRMTEAIANYNLAKEALKTANLDDVLSVTQEVEANIKEAQQILSAISSSSNYFELFKNLGSVQTVSPRTTASSIDALINSHVNMAKKNLSDAKSFKQASLNTPFVKKADPKDIKPSSVTPKTTGVGQVSPGTKSIKSDEVKGMQLHCQQVGEQIRNFLAGNGNFVLNGQTINKKTPGVDLKGIDNTAKQTNQGADKDGTWGPATESSLTKINSLMKIAGITDCYAKRPLAGESEKTINTRAAENSKLLMQLLIAINPREYAQYSESAFANRYLDKLPLIITKDDKIDKEDDTGIILKFTHFNSLYSLKNYLQSKTFNPAGTP